VDKHVGSGRQRHTIGEQGLLAAAPFRNTGSAALEYFQLDEHGLEVHQGSILAGHEVQVDSFSGRTFRFESRGEAVGERVLASGAGAQRELFELSASEVVRGEF